MQQQLHEGDGPESARHTQNRVDAQLERVYQCVCRDVEQGLIAEQHMQNHPRVAELKTTEPSTGACKSPRISSSENSTAAIGVLNAAAGAAEHPTGTSARTFAGLRPNRLVSTDAIPAPICTEGPSRPSAMPLASEIEQQTNLPSTVHSEMKPSLMNSANLVCGMPLSRAPGK